MSLLALAIRRVDPALDEVLTRIGEARSSDGPRGAHDPPKGLLEAMRYAVLSPGKRLRPALVLGSAQAIGGRVEDALSGACAVEMVHAYSLVHDDLPALDNDDLRRGRPTCHRAFGEATALLAGDALLTEALALLADGRALDRGKRVRPKRRLRAVLELSRAIGAAGMVGGQYDDVATQDLEQVEPARLISIHRRKTGRLIQASVSIGAILGGGSPRAVRALRKVGADIGLAFQLVDDAIDGDGFARLSGADAARRQARELTDRAARRLGAFGENATPLIGLATIMVERRS